MGTKKAEKGIKRGRSISGGLQAIGRLGQRMRGEITRHQGKIYELTYRTLSEILLKRRVGELKKAGYDIIIRRPEQYGIPYRVFARKHGRKGSSGKVVKDTVSYV